MSVLATRGPLRRSIPVARSGGEWRARVLLPTKGRWTLAARVAGKTVASRPINAVEPAVRHPYAVVVDPRGRVFVADGAARRIVLISPVAGGRSVHATGFDEPTGLAAARNALFVADFNAGLVRRVDAARRVTTLARLSQVTAVAVSPAGVVYAVTMTGQLVRISASGRIRRSRSRAASTGRTALPSTETGVCSSPRTPAESGESTRRRAGRSWSSTASTRTRSASPGTERCSSPARL